MNCSSCGTRASASQRNCPNCGRNLTPPGSSRTGVEGSSSGSGSQALSPSTAKAPGPRDGLRTESTPKAGRRTKKKRTAASTAEIPLEALNGDSGSDTGTGASNKGTAQIRAQLHDRPDCLEGGLSIYTDAKADPVGIDFATDVGSIDLLARDDAGGLVVVLIADESSQDGQNGKASGKDLVSDALERVGWVRKHIAKPQQEVRAIVLLKQVPDDISYSAAAVASTVAFKTYRMEISFSEVEV